MSESDRSNFPALPRRAVLKGAGLGVGAGLLSGLVKSAAAADFTRPESKPAPTPNPAPLRTARRGKAGKLERSDSLMGRHLQMVRVFSSRFRPWPLYGRALI